jgi:hypothetical protein
MVRREPLADIPLLSHRGACVLQFIGRFGEHFGEIVESQRDFPIDASLAHWQSNREIAALQGS